MKTLMILSWYILLSEGGARAETAPAPEFLERAGAQTLNVGSTALELIEEKNQEN